ncbi:MAG: pilin [Patescibacteria group bacterium]
MRRSLSFALVVLGVAVSVPAYAQSAAVTCESQNAACKLSCESGEQSIGQYSCLSGYLCCKNAGLVQPGGGSGGTLPVPTTGAAAKPVSQAQSPDRLVLPSCTKDGNCTVEDIVQTGVNFATFVMGLSGALFFAVFIYGGALYLTSFGDKGRVTKGKEAIKGAVIGMIFVLGAWTIVNTLVKGLKGQTDGTSGGSTTVDRCAVQGTGYSCTTLNGATGQQALADGSSKGYTCLTGLCPGAVNVLCCKLK